MMLANFIKQRSSCATGMLCSSQRAAFSSQPPEPEYLTSFELLRIKLTPWVHNRRHLNPNAHPTSEHRKPIKVDLVPGQEYLWCSCGLSKNQPFCDKSHIKTFGNFKPLKFTWDGPAQSVNLCACKFNKDESGPRCDGSHNKVDFDNLD